MEARVCDYKGVARCRQWQEQIVGVAAWMDLHVIRLHRTTHTHKRLQVTPVKCEHAL